MQQIFHTRPFVNNNWKNTFKLFNLIEPWSGLETKVQVHMSTPELVQEAATSAQTAFNGPWSLWTGSQRRDLLISIAQRLQDNHKHLAYLESLSGKPIKQAQGDVSASIECFRYFAGCADKIHGTIVHMDSQFRTMTLRQPLGVLAFIVSFNYPLLLAVWKIAPALAVGNTIILKPAPQTPLSALYLAHLMSDLVPEGVFNVLPGDAQVGATLLSLKEIAKVSFTGSTETGRLVAKASSSIPRPATLELGGKNPLIICNDADLNLAVDGIIEAAFANGGQNCCAGSNLYIQNQIYTELIAKLKSKLTSIRMGLPSCLDTDLGPLVDENQKIRVNGFVSRALESGLELFHQGIVPKDLENGFYVPPTVFVNVPDSAEIAQKEIFGPVLSILRPFSTIDEAIQRANSTEYGLGAGIWTRDSKTIDYTLRKLRSGMIWVNTYNDNPAYLPFGGFLNSGFGKDLGSEAIREFSIEKSAQIAFV